MYKELRTDVFMRKCDCEKNSGNKIKVSQPGFGIGDVFILSCEADVYVITWINFQAVSFTEGTKWYNQHGTTYTKTNTHL